MLRKLPLIKLPLFSTSIMNICCNSLAKIEGTSAELRTLVFDIRGIGCEHYVSFLLAQCSVTPVTAVSTGISHGGWSAVAKALTVAKIYHSLGNKWQHELFCLLLWGSIPKWIRHRVCSRSGRTPGQWGAVLSNQCRLVAHLEAYS